MVKYIGITTLGVLNRGVLFMHHKRKRSRNQRAGCKMCKFWKVNGFQTENSKGEKFSDHKRRRSALLDIIMEISNE
jgi:hypothetical protein